MNVSGAAGKGGLEVMIVHPDAGVRSALAQALEEEGLTVVVAGSALDAYTVLQDSNVKLAFIHEGIPDQPGSVLADYLKRNFDMRVAMLSDNEVKPRGGATCSVAVDGHIVEEEQASQLVLHEARRLLRNDEGPVDGQLQRVSRFEGLRRKWVLFSQDWRIMNPSGESVNLTIREFQFMLRLATSREIAVSRKELFQCLRYRDDKHGNRALESLVHRLRKKTLSDGKPLIQTAHGFGYSFSSPVEVA